MNVESANKVVRIRCNEKIFPKARFLKKHDVVCQAETLRKGVYCIDRK